MGGANSVSKLSVSDRPLAALIASPQIPPVIELPVLGLMGAWIGADESDLNDIRAKPKSATFGFF